MSKRFWLVIGLAALVVMLAVAGCGQQQAANQKVIKIGLIAPLTGDVKTFGESTKNAVELALEQAGYKAGDYTIQLIEQDDANDPTQATNVATKLITQDGVKAIIGSVTSKTTIPISEVAQANKVVEITSTATNPKVTVDNGQRKDYVFRACFIDPFQGKVAAKFALDQLHAKTASVIYDKGNDYTVGLAQYFMDTFKAGGGQILTEDTYTVNDTDFSAILAKVAKAKPDILYLPDYYQKVSLIGQQARDAGIKAIFMGGDGWDSSDLNYAVMAGGYFTNHYSPEDTRPEVQKWVQDYKAKYGSTPDALATLAYDATNLLLNAIKTANSDDPTAIRDALAATKDFPAVSGKITFDQDGNPIKPAVILKVTYDSQTKQGGTQFVASVAP